MQGQAAAAMATPRLELQSGEKGCAGGLGLREVRGAHDRCLRCGRKVNPGAQGPPAWMGADRQVEGVAPWGGWQSLMFLGMWLPHSDLCLLLCVCDSLLSLTRTLVIELRVHLSNPG